MIPTFLAKSFAIQVSQKSAHPDSHKSSQNTSQTIHNYASSNVLISYDSEKRNLYHISFSTHLPLCKRHGLCPSTSPQDRGCLHRPPDAAARSLLYTIWVVCSTLLIISTIKSYATKRSHQYPALTIIVLDNANPYIRDRGCVDVVWGRFSLRLA